VQVKLFMTSLILVGALVGFFGGYFFAIRFRWRQKNAS
jgi:hypothetical protein